MIWRQIRSMRRFGTGRIENRGALEVPFKGKEIDFLSDFHDEGIIIVFQKQRLLHTGLCIVNKAVKRCKKNKRWEGCMPFSSSARRRMSSKSVEFNFGSFSWKGIFQTREQVKVRQEL